MNRRSYASIKYFEHAWLCDFQPQAQDTRPDLGQTRDVEASARALKSKRRRDVQLNGLTAKPRDAPEARYLRSTTISPICR